MESKYPVQYWSESKQTYIRIEDMNSAHLANAYKKLLTPTPSPTMMKGCKDAVAEELRSRGATVDGATVTWPSEGDPADERTG